MRKTLLCVTLIVGCFPVLGEQAKESEAKKDPYVKGKEKMSAKVAPSDVPLNISLCYEAFSLPLADAAKLRREDLTDTALYARLVAAVESGAVKQEAFSVVRAKPGMKGATESITESIYPTEWEPAELPNSVGVAITPEVGKGDPKPTADAGELHTAPSLKSLTAVKTQATASRFDTKNVGLTLEVEPNIGADGRWVDVRMALDHIVNTGRSSWGQGVSKLEVPEFEVQRINGGLTLRIDQPLLIGTMNRPPISKVDPNSANQVWFAFLTASIVKY